MKKIIDSKIENYFPSAMSFVGYFLIFLGLLFLYFQSYGFRISLFLVGLTFLFIGINISFAKSGIQIDPDEKKYREYYGLFGLRYGKWKALDKFKYLTILHNRETVSTYSRSNRSIDISDLWFDICLLNENHRQKLIVMRFKSKDKAIEKIKNLSALLGFDVVKYSPEISEATRLRRQRRRR